MQDLRISLVQGDTRWHDPAGNREYYGALLAPLAGTTEPYVYFCHLASTLHPGITNSQPNSAPKSAQEECGLSQVAVKSQRWVS